MRTYTLAPLTLRVETPRKIDLSQYLLNCKVVLYLKEKIIIIIIIIQANSEHSGAQSFAATLHERSNFLQSRDNC